MYITMYLTIFPVINVVIVDNTLVLEKQHSIV